MQILLDPEDIAFVIQDKLQGAIEDYVRDLGLANGRDMSVTLTNTNGVYGATVSIGSTAVQQPAPTIRKPRQSKTAAVTQIAEESHQNTQVELTGRAITDTPEDRQPSAETPAAKPVSIFAMSQAKPAAEPVEQEPKEEAVPEAMGEAPASAPERKSIFSFAKAGAGA